MRRPSVGEPACEKSGRISPRGGFLKAPLDGNAPFAGSVCSTTTHGDAHMALKKLSILTAGFIVLAAGVFPASAQYRDRDDRRGGFSLRFGDDDDDRGWRRGRDRTVTVTATTRHVATVTATVTWSCAVAGFVTTTKD